MSSLTGRQASDEPMIRSAAGVVSDPNVERESPMTGMLWMFSNVQMIATMQDMIAGEMSFFAVSLTLLESLLSCARNMMPIVKTRKLKGRLNTAA